MVERENRKQQSRETGREGRIIGIVLAFPEGVLQRGAGLEERFRSHGVSAGLYFL
jgi:hypothetical protein